MKRFKHILVVYADSAGDDDALLQATDLAVRNSAQLTLVEVLTESQQESSNQLLEHQERLRDLMSPAEILGVPVATKVLRGVPHVEIVQQVIRGKHDLVIMADEQPAGLRSLFSGMDSRRVLRKCPCPMA